MFDKQFSLRSCCALLLSIAALGAALSGCTADKPAEVAAATEAVRVPGRWAPPEDVLRIANAQRVPIVDPPAVSPGGSCSGPDPARDWCTHVACTEAHPGTTAISDYIGRRWPTTFNSGVYGCRRNTNSARFLSVHAVGRAIDISVPFHQGDADNTLGDEIAHYLIMNAEHIGIQRVGWDGMWWNGQRGFGARMCTRFCGDSDFPSGCWPCNPHADHLHIEVSVDAAHERTRFFSEGPPGETCPVVCYGNAAVAEDCSFIDCAASGQVCMSDPVRCETAEPPEPEEATFHPGAPSPSLTLLGPPARIAFIDPSRLFDTRADSSRLTRTGTELLAVGDPGVVATFPELPASSRGAWLNLTAVRGAGTGYVRVSPTGVDLETSSLNFQASSVRNNPTPMAFGDDGLEFEAFVSDTHLIADAFAAFADEGAGLRASPPVRVLDTRDSPEPEPAETTVVVEVGAPEGALGVMASVAVISDGPGFVVAYACDAPVPETSSLNYEGRGVVGNSIIARLSADGELCLRASTAVEFIVDISGHFVAEGELSYQAVSPVRLLDTRDESARYRGRPGEGQTVSLPIAALAGAPDDVVSATLSIVAVGSDERGYVTLAPCGFDPPLTSALNFGSERGAVGSVATATLGDGELCLTTRNRTHLVVDLLGLWVPTPSAPPPTPPSDPSSPDPSIPGEEPDSGMDAGTDDASTGDAGQDAGADAAADTGASDSGRGDAGTSDSGSADSGSTGGELDSGCGCRVSGAARTSTAALLLLPALALLLRRRR